MAGCTEGCEREFKGSNFGLNHEHPHLFVTSQWQNCACTPWFYLVYRLLALAGFAVILTLQVVSYWEDGYRYQIFAYLSYLSFMTLTLDVLLQFIFAVQGYSRYVKANGVWEKAYTYMPWYLKMQWVITNIASCMGILVSIFYWALLYDGSFVADYNIHNIHTTNSAYLLLNLFITAMPVRIYHVLHSMIYVVFYAVLSVIYQLAFDEGALYPYLDWEQPALTVGYIAAIGFLGTTAIWLVYYALYRVRLAIFACMTAEPEDVERRTTNNGQRVWTSADDVDPIYMATSSRNSVEDYAHDNPVYVTTVIVQ